MVGVHGLHPGPCGPQDQSGQCRSGGCQTGRMPSATRPLVGCTACTRDHVDLRINPANAVRADAVRADAIRPYEARAGRGARPAPGRSMWTSGSIWANAVRADAIRPYEARGRGARPAPRPCRSQDQSGKCRSGGCRLGGCHPPLRGRVVGVHGLHPDHVRLRVSGLSYSFSWTWLLVDRRVAWI